MLLRLLLFFFTKSFSAGAREQLVSHKAQKKWPPFFLMRKALPHPPSPSLLTHTHTHAQLTIGLIPPRCVGRLASSRTHKSKSNVS